MSGKPTGSGFARTGESKEASVRADLSLGPQVLEARLQQVVSYMALGDAKSKRTGLHPSRTWRLIVALGAVQRLIPPMKAGKRVQSVKL